MVACQACGRQLKGTEQACPSCGLPFANPHLLPSTKLSNGKYSIGRVLGQGGFGITYQGADNMLNRPVAIKELFPDGATRHTSLLVPPTRLKNQGLHEAIKSFLEEARTLAQFNHPSIVHVLDVFEENFTAYMVMELLQGETLAARLRRVDIVPAHEAIEIARTIADALAVVHRAGLLHRDIKPDNIFLTNDSRSVLIDFGSARGYTSDKTMQHTRLVTPGYAPLEQYSSQAKFGPYTDIYALSATLYHAVTSVQPPPVTDRLTGIELQPLPHHLPSGFRAAIEKGMAIRIDERPGSIEEFISLLSPMTNTAQPPSQRTQPAPSSDVNHPLPAEPAPQKTNPLNPARPLKPPKVNNSSWFNTLATLISDTPNKFRSKQQEYLLTTLIIGAGLIYLVALSSGFGEMADFNEPLIAIAITLGGSVVGGLLTGALVYVLLPLVGLFLGGYLGSTLWGGFGALLGGVIGYALARGLKRI